MNKKSKAIKYLLSDIECITECNLENLHDDGIDDEIIELYMEYRKDLILYLKEKSKG